MRFPAAAALTLALLASACGEKPAHPRAAPGSEPADPLPVPAGAAGGVTGMPDAPGPGPIGPPVPEAPELPLDADGNPVLPEPAGEPAPPAEPAPADAAAVVGAYYDAINRGDFARAYALWSDNGRATGKSLEQFAAGFAPVTGVAVELHAPGPIDATAGTHYIEVPVTATATHRDGSLHRYTGKYVLRRAVVDGTTPEQRQWRIASADLADTASVPSN